MTRVHAVDEPQALDPATAFKILGNETRLGILRVLLEARDRPLTFTELRRQVGMEDGSQFNYHLRKLEPAYVSHDDEGFFITTAGEEVVRSIVAGTFIEHPTLDPFGVDGECVDCGGGLLAWYDGDFVCVGCADCDLLHYLSFLPPGGLLDRTPEEVLAVSDSLLRSTFLLCMDDVCPACFGRLRRTILAPTETLADSVVGITVAKKFSSRRGPAVVYECDRCRCWYHLTIGDTLLFEPAVVEFFRDHDLDLADQPLWTLPWCVSAATPRYATIVSESPLRVAVRIPLDDETLTVTVDENLAVVATERTVSDAADASVPG